MPHFQRTKLSYSCGNRFLWFIVSAHLKFGAKQSLVWQLLILVPNAYQFIYNCNVILAEWFSVNMEHIKSNFLQCFYLLILVIFVHLTNFDLDTYELFSTDCNIFIKSYINRLFVDFLNVGISIYWHLNLLFSSWKYQDLMELKAITHTVSLPKYSSPTHITQISA